MTVLRRPAVVDLTGLTVLTAIALAGFGTVYTGSWYLVMGLAGLALGALAGLAANMWRWPVIAAVLMGVVALIVGAGPLALPETTVAGVLPTWETVKGVYQGAIGGWWELLTTLPPISATGSIALVPYVGGIVCGLSGVLLAWRSKFPLAPMVGPVLLLGAGILFGIAEPASLLIQGAGFSIVALAWATLRHRRAAPPPVTGARLRSRVLGASTIIGAATLAALGVGVSPVAAVAPGERFVLRERVEPPFDPTEYPSPLSAFRRYEVAMKEKVLFSVTGVPEQSRIRLSVMDDYDGLVWTVAGGSGHSSNSGVFQRVGATIPNAGNGPSGRVTVTIRDLGGVWLPTVGSLTELTFTGSRADQLRETFRYNQSTGVGVLKVPVTLQPGDTYDFTSVMPPAPEAAGGARPAQITQPDLDLVPDEIAARAIEWSGSAGGGQTALAALAEKFKTDGAFSDGTAAAGLAVWPGHGAARLREFLGGDQMVGDAEQYAATFALMARQMGVPARVVLGVIPPESWSRSPGPNGTVAAGDVVGSMVTAWVEVRYAGTDWMPLDVTPPITNRPKPPQPRNDPEGTTEVVQPPIIVGQPPVQQPAPGTGEPDGLTTKDGWFGVVWMLIGYLWPLLLAGAIALVLIGLKAHRRRRRRIAGTPRHRMAGGWEELIDRIRDYGIVVNALSTRREVAIELGLAETGLGTSQAGLMRQLAHRADAAIYAPENPTESDAAAYWASLGHSIAQLGQGRPRWRRLLALLNPITLLPTPLIFRRLLEARR